MALAQVGESFRAERELRKLFPRLDPRDRETLMSIAAQNNMPGLAIRLAGIIRLSTGRTYHAALYPIPDWQPDDGFEIDRALLFGIIRQESGFDPRARSRRGARGLMQLMPRTAKSVDEEKEIDHRSVLYRPEVNIALGQRYVGQLLDEKAVKGDLFRLLVAYNAGPGNLRKWLKKVDFDQDPLLFIETMPSRETRGFIEKVLTNVWIYRLQMRQGAPSLDQVAAGDWPRYRSLDAYSGGPRRHAQYR
jgi:soluble lytic murein transglycosylase-like protein